MLVTPRPHTPERGAARAHALHVDVAGTEDEFVFGQNDTLY